MNRRFITNTLMERVIKGMLSDQWRTTVCMQCLGGAGGFKEERQDCLTQILLKNIFIHIFHILYFERYIVIYYIIYHILSY